VQWSYQLLDDRERRVFRAVSAFPGPFTLEGAEAVAGPGAGGAVLRLVDCSLLLPPQAGPDGRTRYAMLETLRAFGAGLLAEAGEEDEATGALAAYAADMAGEAATELFTGSLEAAGLRHMDAEEVTLRHAVAWALVHDPDAALRSALALAPWWRLRSPRERELVTLVAQGRTDAQIGAQLYITVRTVSSHLDRIRDKTGCRRRADLTRLALSAGLV